MPTASIFENFNNQAVRLLKEMESEGINEVSIVKKGDAIILQPVRPSWTRLADIQPVDDDFLNERPKSNGRGAS
jgi:antitoxin VapB